MLQGIPFDGTEPRDHVVEQMAPITTWGTGFIVTPTTDAAILDVFKLVGAEDGTEVNFEGDQVSEGGIQISK